MSEAHPARRVVASIDLGGTKIYGALVHRDGTLLHELRIPTRQDGSPILDQLSRAIDALLSHPLADDQQLVGIGVGVPGVMSRDGGTVVVAPALDWADMPLLAHLRERFTLPIFLENDVNLAALGEYGYGAAQGADSLICIAIGTGIGSGVVLNGRLYRGHSSGAGEVGYMLPTLANLNHRYDSFGALEQQASGTGIAARAKRHGQPDSITTEGIIAAARRGDSWAQDIIAETIDYLSWCIVNVTAVLDPEIVVLSGGVMSNADLFIPSIAAKIDGVLPFQPRVVASTLGAKAATLGGAVLVLTST